VAASTSASQVTPSIAQELSLIQNTGWSSQVVSFGDTAFMGSAGTAMPNGPFAAEQDMSDFLIDSEVDPAGEAKLTALLGFDPAKVRFSAIIGAQPSVTVLYGDFDAALVTKKLAAAGYTQHGAVWTYGSDFTATAANPTGDSGVVVFAVSANRIVFGNAVAPVQAIAAPATTPLSAQPQELALARCLGQAQAGTIGSVPAEQGSQLAQLPGGFGITAGSAGQETEEICVVAPSAAAAASYQRNWTRQISSGTSSAMHIAWSKLFADPQASLYAPGLNVVRLTVQPAQGEAGDQQFLNMYLGGMTSTIIEQ
jgi:hypothetical protein